MEALQFAVKNYNIIVITILKIYIQQYTTFSIDLNKSRV